MGYLPLERYQVSIDAGAVVEGQAFVEGHYLEALAFTYSPWQAGRRAAGLAAVDTSVST